MPLPTAQQVNLPACSPHCPFNAERQVKVIGLTRLGIKPESTAQETDALYHSPSELFLRDDVLDYKRIDNELVEVIGKIFSLPCLDESDKCCS